MGGWLLLFETDRTNDKLEPYSFSYPTHPACRFGSVQAGWRTTGFPGFINYLPGRQQAPHQTLVGVGGGGGVVAALSAFFTGPCRFVALAAWRGGWWDWT